MSTEFFKSTHSGANQSCVEIAHRADVVLIRDSKYVGPEEIRPLVTVSAAHWAQFLELVLDGRSAQLGELAVTVHNDGGASIAGSGHTLDYTPDEWDAFLKGIVDRQFDRPA
ncbi:DUF397 domain-containing protein [Nocardia uniformis]|uniref:DUF397 domain-containing protein n=1 Tax=Nocardia uniformis TaxID=53432 RepID=A0A849CBS9_9NOCA|nr:DUF397 domain-containing protein [Nocardia uniformis]NNH73745.1 DUF397 domain-containing protein [Nocardia uniformis]